MLSVRSKERLNRFKPLYSAVEYGIPKLFAEHPFKVLYYLLYKKLVYQRTQKGKIKEVKTFFGEPMQILLPAGLDIYFFGLKSHPSELSLSKFLVNTLKEGDAFIDIGAHFGYYTKLASNLVGSKGKVIAIEASPETYKILTKNTANATNIDARNIAISDMPNSHIEFCVFPIYYSELNTINVGQYQNSDWFHKVESKLVKVPTTTLQALIEQTGITPKLIKIDVEGAEERVVKGSLKQLEALTATGVIIEFINDEKPSENYHSTEALLTSANYRPHYIKLNGELAPITGSILGFMQEQKLSSENIVFLKK